ncbi:cupin domain-containing protein [Nocardioides piscis]|uniref:Cupin domain-containing protein n=1 Tax=Nocardioides piscis TaxID=2714938 RepID=A0A6G7YDV7_9ACTN|nr:cupin domain-containing protein [Nocardioides piscis]QIK74909.1 cupin domain-containing protein [Nocardioides piscis]
MSNKTSTVTAKPTPRVLRSPRSVEMLGNRLDLLVEADDFPRASVVRYTVAPGFTAPPQLHHHVSDDVLMIVLAGALAVSGVEGEVEAGPGEVVVLRHGTPFAWRNASAEEEAVYLGVYAPGGFEQYFPAIQAAASSAGGLSPEVVFPLWEQYGIAVSDTD